MAGPGLPERKVLSVVSVVGENGHSRRGDGISRIGFERARGTQA